jgi:hypothetical protein
VHLRRNEQSAAPITWWQRNWGITLRYVFDGLV